MKILKNLSIRYKLRIIITLTSGIVLLLASIAFVSTDIKRFRADMASELLVLADLVGRNSTPGLLFNDTESATGNLQLLKAEKRVLFAHIFDKKGNLFASYFAAQLTKIQRQHSQHDKLSNSPFVQSRLGLLAEPDDIPEEGLSLFQDDHLDTLIPLKFEDGALIGAVYIQADTAQLTQRLFNAAKIVGITLLIALVLALVLASSLESILTQPVFHLLENMGHVAKIRDYSIRATKMSQDELGQLTDGFNTMLGEIEKSNLKLKQYQEHLEEMVEQRTAELAESRDQALAANEALKKRGEELAVARDAAEAANHAKSTFLANMSHELRTPLNGILGYTQILGRDKGLNTNQKDGIEIIHRSGEYLLTLINDILDLSKIEAGRIELFPNDFILHDFILSLREIFVIRAQEKGVIFQTLLGSDSGFDVRPLPVALHADEKRLRQILLNLLSNAVKFTDQGEVRLKIGYDAQKICFAVEDTGVGIATEDIDTVFAPFQQVGDVLHKAEGTGLGMPITKKLINMMGGEIELTSTPGEGSCFSFSLVLAIAETVPEHSTQKILPLPVAYQRLSGQNHCKVLVVDDNAVNRLLVKNMLQPLEFNIIMASDGQEALDKIAQEQPDIILMDLIMPGMDGFECTRQLREHPQENLCNIPIVVASASAFEADKKRSFALGATGFITKPIKQTELLEQLEQILQLEWIYEDDEEEQSEEAQTWVPPTTAQAKVLQELTIIGDFRGLQEYLDAILKENPQLQPFSQEVHKLAKAFEEDEILEILSKII
ncbi:ATP-binding protein [Candidatus Venteria ishoeyi]|uniref:ATP-binding protein n=1 Tax=Candidatus Venteria ishoeyi TaxID=1899563 RepID=UPI0025A52C7E|nr:ATP-binding protein [Candidatus Venteria ishoeyi]MDM8545402.1 ATP-binding protein [Candidatus Venteria ishoeyi]